MMVMIPVLGLVYFVTHGINQKIGVLEEMTELHDLANLVIKISDFVHESQKERGITSGYIGGGDNHFYSKLLEQRTKTDEKASELKLFLTRFDIKNKHVSLSLNKALTNITKLVRIRKTLLDKKNKNNDGYEAAFQFYTNMHSQFLGVAEHIANVNKSSELTSFIYGYVHFLLGKEKTGQERAILSNVFAKKKFQQGMYQKFVSLIADQDIYNNVFLSLASKKQIAFYKETMRHDSVTKVSIIRKEALQSYRKDQLINQLEDHLGYGGLIHNFKNYLIRGQLNDARAFNKHYHAILKVIKEYKSIILAANSDHKKLDQIKEVVNTYKDKLSIVIELKKKDLDIPKIDIIVQVDDSLALDALHGLLYEHGLGIEPIYWYNTITKKINLLKKVENRLADDLKYQAIELQHTARFDLIFYLFLSGFITMGSFSLIYLISSQILRHLGGDPVKIADIALRIARDNLDDPSDIGVNRELSVLAVIEKLAAQVKKYTSSLQEYIDKLRQEIAERLKVEKALRESEEQFRDLVVNINDALFIINLQGVIEYISPVTETISGFKPDEFIGKDISNFILPEDFSGVISRLQKIYSGESVVSEFRIYHKYSDYIWIRASGRPKLYKDKVIGVQGIFTDITKRKQVEEDLKTAYDQLEQKIHARTGDLARANEKLKNEIEERKQVEEALRQSEKRLSLHIQKTPLAYIEWDNNFKVVAWNSSAERIFGYSKEEALGKHDYEMIVEENMQPYVAEIWQRVMTESSELSYVTENLTNEGRNIICEWYYTNLIDDDGQAVGLASLAHDITERKQAEKKIRLAAAVFENINESIIVTDIEGCIQSVNPAFVEMLNYLPEDVIGHKLDIFQAGHHDSDFYKTMWAELRQDRQWAGEIWNRRRNGDTFPAWLSISAIEDEADNVIQYAGVISDITGRKQYEEQIKYKAYHDALTALPNRDLLNDRLNLELIHSSRENNKIAVMFLDLDGFKQVNDNFGHDKGDILLQNVAQRLIDCVRKGDTVARLGGDEFIIVIPKLRQLNDLSEIAQKIINRIKDKYLIADHEVYIGISIGISIYPDNGTDSEILLKKADEAMYRVKQKGKNNYAFA